MLEALGGQTESGRFARQRQRFANAASVHAPPAILSERIHLENLTATSTGVDPLHCLVRRYPTFANFADRPQAVVGIGCQYVSELGSVSN